LAKAYKAQGKDELAIQNLKQAQALGSENEQLHIELARLFKRRRYV